MSQKYTLGGRKIEAAIFDLDGTIADSLDVWSRIDTAFFASHNMEMPGDYLSSVKSMGSPDAASYTKRRFGFSQNEDEIMEQWGKMAQHEYAVNIPLKYGAREFILALHSAGVKLGLATASGSELFEPLLKRHGVYDCFSSHVTTMQAGKDKSHPDVYLLCAKELCCEPAGCMVFEDILPAVCAAKKAGMMVTGVYDSHSSADRREIEAAADFYIESFTQAMNALLKNNL